MMGEDAAEPAAPEAPQPLDPALLGLAAAPAPAPASEPLDLLAMMGGEPAPAPAPAPDPLAPGLGVDLTAMPDVAADPAPAPVKKKKKKRKGVKIGGGDVPKPAKPQAVPDAAPPAATPQPTVTAEAPGTPAAMPGAAVAQSPMSTPGSGKKRKKATTLEGQIADKERKISTFIEAQIKIMADSNRLEKAIVEARRRVTQLEADLEAAITAEDFAKSGQIQKDTDELTAALTKSAVDLKRNEARYNKGEAAKHKQMNTLAALREKQMVQLTTFRAQSETDAKEFVGVNTEKLTKGEEMLRTLAEKVASNKKQLETDKATVAEAVAIVEKDVVAGTAPEQEKKAAEEVILEGIDSEIAELERQLAAKQEERAVVVARVDVIEAAIQEVRDKFTEPYEKINTDKAAIEALEAETKEKEEMIVERRDQLESFRAQSVEKRLEFIETIKSAAAKEAEQQAKVAMVRWYIAENQGIAATKERRDAEEAEKVEALSKLKAELTAFTTQNQQYATSQMESQRLISQLRTDIEAAERSIPELEQQKKLAIAARNFDEAGRVSEEAKKLTAAKEANEAKKAEAEAEVKAKEAANAEVNSKLQEMEAAVGASEKDVNAFHYETLCAQIKAMKGLMEVAAEDGEEVAARLLQRQVEVAEQAAAGLASKDGMIPADLSAVRPERPTAGGASGVELDEFPERKIEMSQEEAQELVALYEETKAGLDKRIEEAVEAEDFPLCSKINAEVDQLTEMRRFAGTVLKAAGIEVADLPEPAAPAPAPAADPPAEEAPEAAEVVEEKEEEPAAPMSAEEAEEVLAKLAELEGALQKAIEEEDFGACSGINAEIDALAAKKAEAEALQAS